MTIRGYLDLFVKAKTDIHHDYQFWVLIEHALCTLGISQKDLAHEFGVTMNTVKRWLNRGNAPHPEMRKVVFAYLEKRAKEKLAGLVQG